MKKFIGVFIGVATTIIVTLAGGGLFYYLIPKQNGLLDPS